ncbi:hypothetical protein ACTA71_000422 [Dictyostelium dimigraforme]
MNKKFTLCLFLLSLFILSTFVTNAQDDDEIDQEEEDFTTNRDVKQRGLVRENVSAKQILNNYNKYFKNVEIKNFQEGNTLVYITPWNGKGYNVATKWAKKFSHISPVWHQVKFENNKVTIEGDHNIDKKWMEKVKENSDQKSKILPRFSFEGQQWGSKESFQKFIDPKLIDSLVSTVKKNNYDGLVIEGIVHLNRQLRDPFLVSISEKLHSIGKEIILVIYPFRQKGQETGFGPKDFELLSNHLDGISLMTYDFGPSGGMNAPKVWVEDNLKFLLPNGANENSKKIFMGIPFYGYKVGENDQSDAIVGSEFISILKQNKSKKLKFDQNTHEHIFTYKNKKNQQVSITYPSLLFIEDRIQLATKYKVSISIWEIGQGLDYFMDLL